MGECKLQMMLVLMSVGKVLWCGCGFGRVRGRPQVGWV